MSYFKVKTIKCRQVRLPSFVPSVCGFEVSVSKRTARRIFFYRRHVLLPTNPFANVGPQNWEWFGRAVRTKCKIRFEEC